MHSKQQKTKFKDIKTKHKSILSWRKNTVQQRMNDIHSIDQQQHKKEIDFNKFSPQREKTILTIFQLAFFHSAIEAWVLLLVASST